MTGSAPPASRGGRWSARMRGARPIEEVRAGDQVLTQDTTTGKLDYRPVVTVFHNPPNMTYRIDLGSESVFPTGIHRFWKSGHGWIMARDVKAGDRLRTIGGTVEVSPRRRTGSSRCSTSCCPAATTTASADNGVLAHDNGFVEPVEHPFDGVPALADLGASPQP